MVCLKRLEEHFQKLSAIGKAKSGITRLAFSDVDWQARSFIMQLMEEAGLALRMDAFGNLIGRREGKNPKAPVVMLGSHIDSVPNGGNFDGIVGVLGAIEVLQCIQEREVQTYHPIEVVAFMAEESSRFGIATLGSKAFLGELSLKNLEEYKDQQGRSLAEAMSKQGLVPENISESRYTGDIKAFIEMHIEQGKVLETTKKKIGVVTAIAAPTRFFVIITGQADHSGATPMNMRQDALTAAAEIILLVERLAKESLQNEVVATTGIIKAEPGVMNVIPGQVEIGIDIRGVSARSKQIVIQKLLAEIENIQYSRKVDMKVKTLTDELPVQLSQSMVAFLCKICSKHAYPYMTMPSGAGHDAMHLATITETGMIFIPCRNGISHNSAEWANIADIAAGTEILLDAVLHLAQGDLITLQME